VRVRVRVGGGLRENVHVFSGRTVRMAVRVRRHISHVWRTGCLIHELLGVDALYPTGGMGGAAPPTIF